MSAAAMLVYPDFYKVAVSSCGNHDNNIYDYEWGELHYKNSFSKNYVDRVKSLKPSAGCVTLKYGLDKMPYDIPLYMYCSNTDDFSAFKLDLLNGIVPETPHMFMPIITASDPELGKLMYYLYTKPACKINLLSFLDLF